MSYHFRGRYTHDLAEYRRWQREAEADDARAAANASRAEAASLRERLAELDRQYDEDVRATARRQANIEQQQEQYRHLLDQVARRQEEFEERTERAQEELERDLRDEIGQSEERVREEIQKARAEATKKIAEVRQDVEAVRNDMQRGFAAVDQRITTVREEFKKKTAELKDEIEQERNVRLAKETSRAAEAAALIDWLDKRLGDLRNTESLGLTIEVVRVQESVRNARQRLAEADKERALPIADSAFSDYQTTYIESERRKGTIDGVADHVQQSVERLRVLVADPNFESIFAEQGHRLRGAADVLEKRANGWRASSNWHAFQNERSEVVGAANALVTAAVELQSAIPNLTRRISQRDTKIDDIAAAVTDLMGAADSFEATFANPNDPKSPRLLRARIGHASIDSYLHLDGGFDVEAYGFQSAGDCQRMADRMNRKLQELWHVDTANVSHTNPQSPSINVAARAERWQAIAEEIGTMTSSLV